MMMITGKLQSIPLTHSEKSSHERQQNINLFNAPKTTKPNLEASSSPPPVQKQQRSKSRSKAKSTSKAKQQPQQQQQEKQAESELQPSSQTRSSSSKRNATSGKVVIPPRSVEVRFNSNSSGGSQKAMLKSTADDLKHSTQDIKNLLVASPTTDGSKQNSRSSSSSSSNNSNASNHKKNAKKSPNSQYAKLNNALNKVARLPDGSEPDFNNSRNHSAPLSRSSSSTSARTSKPNSASSNSSASTDGIRYAGSSFHAEPKAVTLPKPSFLRK